MPHLISPSFEDEEQAVVDDALAAERYAHIYSDEYRYQRSFGTSVEDAQQLAHAHAERLCNDPTY